MNDGDNLVAVQLEAGVAHLRFNHPQSLNAIGVAMAEAFLRATQQVLADPGTRVIVLSGEGRAFMAGGDLQAFHADPVGAPDTARAIIKPLHEAVNLLADGNVPVIASVHGAVAGAGMSLALGSDLVIAADNSKFVLAYPKIGASPDGGGSWALVRRVGYAKAMEMLLLAEPFDALAALQLGVVNKVVPAADLLAETHALARKLAEGPTRAYGEIRKLLKHSLSQSLSSQLAQERCAFVRCAETKDFAEGVAAFLEKRAASFTGA